VRPPLFRHGDEHRLARPIERGDDTHPARCGADIVVHVSHYVDAGVEPHDADAPRQPLAKE
jgi:hypothetical protein